HGVPLFRRRRVGVIFGRPLLPLWWLPLRRLLKGREERIVRAEPPSSSSAAAACGRRTVETEIEKLRRCRRRDQRDDNDRQRNPWSASGQAAKQRSGSGHTLNRKGKSRNLIIAKSGRKRAIFPPQANLRPA